MPYVPRTKASHVLPWVGDNQRTAVGQARQALPSGWGDNQRTMARQVLVGIDIIESLWAAGIRIERG